MKVRSVEQPLVAGLYADETVLLAESEGMLQRIVDEFDREMCYEKAWKWGRVRCGEMGEMELLEMVWPY